MYDPLLLPELREMLLENDTRAMKEFCVVLYPGIVAENLEALTDEEVWKILSQADLKKQAEIFEFIGLNRQTELVQQIDSEKLSNLIGQMAPDNRADLLETLDVSQVELMLPLLAQAERADIRKLLSYPEHSAGSIMTTDYASLPEGLTVGDALAQLRLQAPDRETIYYVYVTDEHRRLRGLLSLRKLILARPDTLIDKIIEKDVISVRVDEDQEEAARKIAKYDFIAMPVVDDQNRLVGIITHDDVLDVVQEEATEDAYRMGGVGPLEEDYLEASFLHVWRKRAFWLSCLFAAELCTFSALAHYDDAIKKLSILSLFLPLCISTGGNSGSQAATMICRAMALGQVQLRDWWRVIRHEFCMGLALGLTLGVIGYFRAAATPESLLDGTSRWMLALVISQSVAAICIWGTLVGSTLPLIFKRFGIDPGIASSPFVATFVDVTGIIIYFTFATIYVLPAVG